MRSQRTNAHRNRQNYIIGTGHVYTVVGKSKGVPQAAIDRVKDVLDTILKANKWAIRQQEIKLRDDRDGETFIRKFGGDDGIMRSDLFEPRQIQPPPDAKPHQALGVETLENDCETPLRPIGSTVLLLMPVKSSIASGTLIHQFAADTPCCIGS